ncbi:MAG: TldD/PmbA family protein, partial [Clostridia bacterium]|nr:TldD/PmbA family protein [Clostridia bacterium]
LPGGLASQPFDAVGVAARTNAVIENGKLTTLLHNLKTARKAGVKTTGNAANPDYAGAVNVSPSNFFLAPGKKTLKELMQDMGDGLVITEVSGLHAGANPISGDFSLIAQGYTVKDGKKDKPVEQITVAGNFYQLLKNIRAVGSDLTFPGSSIGSPSVDVGEIAVAGK